MIGLRAAFARLVAPDILLTHENAQLRLERDALARDRDYWKTRAEKLTDLLIVERTDAGVAIMHEPPPPAQRRHPFSNFGREVRRERDDAHR